MLLLFTTCINGYGYGWNEWEETIVSIPYPLTGWKVDWHFHLNVMAWWVPLGQLRSVQGAIVHGCSVFLCKAVCIESTIDCWEYTIEETMQH